MMAAAHAQTSVEIRTALEGVLTEHFETPCKVQRMRRRRSAFSSSYSIENLYAELDGGQRLRVVLKDISPSAVRAFGCSVRPNLVYRPQREIEVYQKVLHSGLGTPRYYGAIGVGEVQRYWLFLERVNGSPLWCFGRLDAWKGAARWLASLHREFALPGGPRAAQVAGALIRHDAPYYCAWLRRAEEFLRRQPSGSSTALRRFGRLVDRYDQVVDQLLSFPRALIHGEFYPSNILVRKTPRTLPPPRRRTHRVTLTPSRRSRQLVLAAEAVHDRKRASVCPSLEDCDARDGQPFLRQPDPFENRICPLDWEMAGVGPGLMDLAALVSGNWSEGDRRELVGAYRDGLSASSSWPGDLSEMVRAVNYCRLQAAVQWLGWSEAWSPPDRHAQDWLLEALRLAASLEI